MSEVTDKTLEALPFYVDVMRRRVEEFSASLGLEDWDAMLAFIEDISVRTITVFGILKSLKEANQFPVDKPQD